MPFVFLYFAKKHAGKARAFTLRGKIQKILMDDFFFPSSILDQQQKQVLHFSGGRFLGNFDGKLLVGSSNSVYAITPVPIETQIQSLLDNDKVEEALELAENAQLRGRSSRENFQLVLNHVRIKAAFICFKNLQLERAKELFIRGKLDPREVSYFRII